MSDLRIPKLREATEAMVAGRYRVDVPVGSGDADGDDVASLGSALVLLGHTLERRFAELTSLNALTEKINSGLLVNEILDHVFESFQTIIPYDRIGFSFLEDQGRVVRAVWARSNAPELKIQTGYTAPLAGSSLQQIIETGRPRILNDLEAHLRAHPESTSTRLIVDEGVRSSLTCPLVAMGKPVGFLFFSSFRPRTYENEHVDVFMQVAGHLSLIVEKGRLYQELAKTKRELEHANQRLSELATIDGLTRIPNRRALDERLTLAWRRGVRHGTPLTLLMVDIDAFKAFNDMYGHLVGDECLKRVAASLESALRRPDDFVGRYGGEEFLIVAEMTGADGGAKLAEILRTRIESLALPSGDEVAAARVTVSIGVAATLPSREGVLTELVGAADRALYRAKESGRNRVDCAPAEPRRE